MSRSERIAQQLGMSHGAAAGRLRKMVLFDLLRKAGQNICFMCSKEIGTADDLSIEHKKPWENRDASLFWDLSNIAFSHTVCNRPHEYNGVSPVPRIVGPEGTGWCRTHKRFLPLAMFSNHNQTWNGVRRDCRECEKKYKDFYRYGKISEDGGHGAQPVSNTGPTLTS